MADEADGQDQAASGGKSVRFVQLSSAAMGCAAGQEPGRGQQGSRLALTPYFVIDDAVRLWRLRVSQIAADPGSARWVARAVVAEPEGVVAGHAGFHGPSDQTGMVEVPYSADPAYRRRGYARAMLRELLRHAAAKPGVSTVRATISPRQRPVPGHDLGIRLYQDWRTMGRGGRPRAHLRSRPADITSLTCPAIAGAARGTCRCRYPGWA
jgi:[ribosomal protein S5]-alanine N-acetyltransferase